MARFPRPIRDAVLPRAAEHLNARQRQRALEAVGRIIKASDDLAALGEEQGHGITGTVILGFATAMGDRARQLKDYVER